MDNLRQILENPTKFETQPEQLQNRIYSTIISIYIEMCNKVGQHEQVHDDYILRFAEYISGPWVNNQPPEAKLAYLVPLLTSKFKLLSFLTAQAMWQVAQNTPFALSEEFWTLIAPQLARINRDIHFNEAALVQQLLKEVVGNSRLKALAGIDSSSPASLDSQLKQFLATTVTHITFALCTSKSPNHRNMSFARLSFPFLSLPCR